MSLSGLPKEINNDDDPIFVFIKKPMLGETYLRPPPNSNVEEAETNSDSKHETPKYDINKYLLFDNPTVDVASENELDEEDKLCQQLRSMSTRTLSNRRWIWERL